MKDFLFSDSGRDYLLAEYVSNRRSTYDIAKDQQTYPNLVNRALKYHKIPRRDKKEAQQSALAAGRHAHPTRGRERSQSERDRISDGVSRAWRLLDDEARNRRIETAKRNWQAMPEAEKNRFLEQAREAVRMTTLDGSKLERYVHLGLLVEGYNAKRREDLAVGGDKVRVDILLPSVMAVVEIDGPAHFLPLWGEEQLVKTVHADALKHATLLSGGYSVVRVKCMAQTVSDKVQRDALEAVLGQLRLLKAGDNKLVEIDLSL